MAASPNDFSSVIAENRKLIEQNKKLLATNQQLQSKLDKAKKTSK